jgi:PAS domain S-box-containing protein
MICRCRVLVFTLSRTHFFKVNEHSYNGLFNLSISSMQPEIDGMTSLSFLSGGGETGALMRSLDWSASPLGHPETWPQSLRTVVSLLLNSKFPMFVAWGPDLAFLYNDSYRDVLGAKHPAIGKRFYDIWSEIWTDISPMIERALQGEATYSERLLLRMRRHGFDENTWFTFSYSPVRDETGNVSGMFCACVEVTGEVLAEKYRNEEVERFRTLFSQAPGFMAILRGPNHVFDLTNKAYSQLVGHRPILGKKAREALPEVIDQGFIQLLDQVYTSGEPYVGRSISIKLQREPHGPLEERFVDFVYQPIRDPHGNVTGIFAEGNDVTEQRKNEAELRQVAADLMRANQRQDEFLATLAHELRNPLAPIRTGLDLMRMGIHEPASLNRVREMLERQTDHLIHLVNDLLDLARIRSGKIELRMTSVILKDIVLNAVETTLPLIEAKSHEFGIDVPDEPIWLKADANRLAQVISNLLTNAAKYTEPNGRIDLKVRREGDTAIVSVTDNGIGIPAEAAPHIFDMFTQVGHGIDHSQGGLGIGLSLVKRLTERHGGTVTMASNGPGTGSTFVLALPVVSAGVSSGHSAGTEEAVPRKDMPVPHARRLRVLIADDNADAVEVLKQLLELGGHTVEVAHDGQEALAKAMRFLPELALCDLGMPVMNGYELAQAIRETPELKATRLVAITGWGAEEDRIRTREAGFDYHLIKPVDFKGLSSVIEEVCG